MSQRYISEKPQTVLNLTDDIAAVVPNIDVRVTVQGFTQTCHPPAEALKEHAQVVRKDDPVSIGYRDLEPELPPIITNRLESRVNQDGFAVSTEANPRHLSFGRYVTIFELNVNEPEPLRS